MSREYPQLYLDYPKRTAYADEGATFKVWIAGSFFFENKRLTTKSGTCEFSIRKSYKIGIVLDKAVLRVYRKKKHTEIPVSEIRGFSNWKTKFKSGINVETSEKTINILSLLNTEYELQPFLDSWGEPIDDYFWTRELSQKMAEFASLTWTEGIQNQ